MTSPLIPHCFSQIEWEEIRSAPEEKAYHFVDEKIYWKAYAIMNFINIEPKALSAFRLKVAQSHFQEKQYERSFDILMQVFYHPEERKQLMRELSSKSTKAHNYLSTHLY